MDALEDKHRVGGLIIQAINEIVPSVVLEGGATEEDKTRVQPPEMLRIELGGLDEVHIDDAHRI